MKVLQEQYNLIKEGKGNKQHFMKLACYNFPELITPVLTYTDAITILKNKSILSEGIGGLVTTGRKQDWHAIFNENMANLKEEKEAKAEEKETTKEVTDMATRGYDYKDEKNYDNVFGQEFLKGYYTEMKDPKNEGKNVEELRVIVAKNLAKDISHYVKDGQFGVKGVGYTTEAPGLGEPKEAKGKFKSSGYGDLKESAIRALVSEMIKEVLNENMGIEDELYDIIAKYVKDADDIDKELNNYFDKGYQGFSDALKANLSKDMDFQTWVQIEHDKETLKREIGEALKPEDNISENYEDIIKSNNYSEEEAYNYLENKTDLSQLERNQIISAVFGNNKSLIKK